MEIQRPEYLDRLIAGQGNNLIKIITGGRRCGKSYLLFTLFNNYLLGNGVEESHIIKLSLDDLDSRPLRDPRTLLDYVNAHIQNDGKTNYVFLDEVQLVEDFVELLLSLMHKPNLQVYVTGSNSKFLSKDVVTEFRGRGQEIRVWPLSFKECYDAFGGDRKALWEDYYTYGGLPETLQFGAEADRMNFLNSIYDLTYLNDVIERNRLRNPQGLRQLAQIVASSIGSPLNPKRICNTFQSVEGLRLADTTIKEYLSYLQDAFLIEEALRYDVKGRKYIGAGTKYYFCDLGLRAAALGFRQQEEPHIMENVIYNELRSRGYLVDVGAVESWVRNSDGSSRKQSLEVDFVVNQGPRRTYIQSAYTLPSDDKLDQEQRPLLKICDHFRKVIIVWDDIHRKVNTSGIVTISLLDFLLDRTCLESM